MPADFMYTLEIITLHFYSTLQFTKNLLILDFICFSQVLTLPDVSFVTLAGQKSMFWASLPQNKRFGLKQRVTKGMSVPTPTGLGSWMYGM